MPLLLSDPIVGPVITRKEIIGFTIDLVGKIAVMTFAHITEAGTIVGQSNEQSALFREDGTPRFSLQLYSDIKQMLYVLAIEDGHVVGTVE